ncbi:Gibberellin 3-beta-dioxygenase [Bertholletia excelsa]
MGTLSEAYRNDPLPIRHIIPIDFHSLKSVPESHVWPQSDDHLPSRVPKPEEEHRLIPIVDLLDPNVVGHVARACETWGMFQVTNHGVRLSLLEDIELEARRLFSLPATEKMKVLRSPEGATGYGAARIAPFFPKSMWYEGFTIMGSSVDDHARALWPDDYKRFSDVMEEYQKEMKALAHRLLLLILKTLSVSDEEIRRWAVDVQGSAADALQLNSYPACPEPSRAIGLAPHTDSMLLTILHQSAAPDGLQVLHGAGWVAVPPVAGALTVNVGDLLHIFSNGKLPTAYHRAMVSQTHHRISVAYFYGPRPDSAVAPFLGPRDVPIYRSVTVGEYIGIKAKHLRRALSLIRI